ncbi:MAG: mechanosensitive ion channel family protein [Spirochaetales bacterium]|nr:mechanosensitive ion channel family protein [Spirochaetales bacterium]
MNGTDIAAEAAETAAGAPAESAASLLEALRGFVSAEALTTALKAAAILVIGLALVRLAALVTGKLTRGRLQGRGSDLAVRAVRYAGFVLVLVNLFDVLGINLSALLGAAGIAGVAIGFAAQTSMSNLISGVFLLSEKAFDKGDVIQVDATVGVVETVDLLSVKLRTFDNRLIRIPNETMVKSNIINATRYPIRRVDFPVGVAYGTDLARAREVLMELAAASPWVLAEPEPLFIADGFGASAINLLFGPWVRKEDYLAVKNELVPAIAKRFDEEGIVIAFQTLTLNGSVEARVAPKPKAAPPRAGVGKPARRS